LEGKVDCLESYLCSMMKLAVDLEAKMSSEIAEIKKLQKEVVELRKNKNMMQNKLEEVINRKHEI